MPRDTNQDIKSPAPDMERPVNSERGFVFLWRAGSVVDRGRGSGVDGWSPWYSRVEAA